jgi:hypothetical protein
MNAGLSYRRATKKYLGFSDKEVQSSSCCTNSSNCRRMNILRTRQQRILADGLLNHFSPKQYPHIFLDHRLRSALFNTHTIYRTK